MLSRPSDSVLQEADLANKKANNWVPGRSIGYQTISRSENHTPSDLHI